MAIQRSGPTPPFLDYAIGFALIPRHSAPSQQMQLLVAHNFEWIDIPTYQRGVAWSLQQVEELLQSNSILLGNVILGQFGLSPGQFPFLPPGVRSYSLLIDGLQRFSVGTALLSLLFPRVLSSTPSHAADAGHFVALAARTGPMAPIFQHNDLELSNHPRQAVSDAYRVLRTSLEAYIDEMLACGQGQALARAVDGLFLRKQVAIDTYFNFASAIELTNTFIGINTVRVDLGPVDLLRSYIVDKALASGWTPTAIETMENTLTDVFTEADKPIAELLPFVAIILQCVTTPGKETHVFSSWPGALAPTDVDNFLEYVRRMHDFAGNGYVQEIRATGTIPFAGVLCYFYREYLHGNPKFQALLSGGTADDADLHKYLCANYRALLSGRLGRSRVFSERLLQENVTLGTIADELSQASVRVPVGQPVAQDWLRATLRRVDKQKSPRMFNAARLPLKSAGWGTAFVPDRFGMRATEYHVDHLLPTSIVDRNQPGAVEAETLANFAPLPSNQNRVAQATSCSSKLCAGGIYGAYVHSHAAPHPYCQWLVQNQGGAGSDLDRQELLEPNQQPDLVGPRIDWWVDRLQDRL